ncbi:MAG: hypothetical protein [Cressdnaviricota sp.]|nr:MAG: hypothetical protein [Cressdnaviricota sp.]
MVVIQNIHPLTCICFLILLVEHIGHEAVRANLIETFSHLGHAKTRQTCLISNTHSIDMPVYTWGMRYPVRCYQDRIRVSYYSPPSGLCCLHQKIMVHSLQLKQASKVHPQSSMSSARYGSLQQLILLPPKVQRNTRVRVCLPGHQLKQPVSKSTCRLF